jgi:predicted nucleotidyltransferase
VGELADRRSDTDRRITLLRERLKPTETIAAGKASVYATGSFGRREASSHSDLDLFIAGKSDVRERGSLLRSLDEICIKADLIEVTRALGIPEFSGDGRYLVHYPVHKLTRTLGTPDDDATNTFTARLLLLLESYPLLEVAVYEEVIGDVTAAYWRDYEDHKNDFVPGFLANDILRLWRTFCVNYEARTSRKPDEEKAKGKLKNYKLKHSRLLTCYSGLLYLLAVYGLKNSVTPQDAVHMVRMTPTERLEWLMDQPGQSAARRTIGSLLEQYERFLETTNVDESQLIQRFLDRKVSTGYMEAASRFGDLMFEALTIIGGGNRFHRLLIV